MGGTWASSSQVHIGERGNLSSCRRVEIRSEQDGRLAFAIGLNRRWGA